jgi:transcriptional regulator with XRE-family HTH domain
VQRKHRDRGRDIGRRIGALLVAKGWRKTDLIARSGLKPASIYQWLRGESEPRGAALGGLAQALEVSTDYLLGLDPSDTDLGAAHVAARESLRVCLRRLGIGPDHPDYLLYQELAQSDGAPTSVKGWQALITDLLPRVTGHLRTGRRSERSEKASHVLPMNVRRGRIVKKPKSTKY